MEDYVSRDSAEACMHGKDGKIMKYFTFDVLKNIIFSPPSFTSANVSFLLMAV